MAQVDGSLDRSGLKHPVLDRLPRLRAAADQHGFECLDDTWKGLSAMYRFRCVQGHAFQRTLQTFGRSRELKCPECVADAHWARVHALALAAGVQCLELQWLGWKVAHRFRCKEGHVWSRVGNRALQNTDCPHCGRSSSYERKRVASLARLREVAAERGGRCLATAYAGSNHPYRFRCAAGHEWEALGGDVLRRTWCPECARLRKVEGYRHLDGLERLLGKAAAHGGRCLSDTYLGAQALYRFRCSQGHEWEAPGKRILRGGWCLKCAYDKKRLTLEDAHTAAKARGGQCLSTTYIRVSVKLHWLCDRGHSWHAPLAAIRAGHWCAECAHMARITNPKSKARMRYKVV
ncbi:hypothetical protein [Pseudomonas chlororaphis]|uniref:hypothetical protein n=1 Tax=Pseudomonas chlororaphis TaxID=587753 RepID=UPI0012D352C2|nr:hypothetical protein [Pseudomonas chlororaphis]